MEPARQAAIIAAEPRGSFGPLRRLRVSADRSCLTAQWLFILHQADRNTLADKGGVIRRRAQPDVLSRSISDRKSAARRAPFAKGVTAVIAIAVPARLESIFLHLHISLQSA